MQINDSRHSQAQLPTVAVSCQLNTWDGTHVGFFYQREDQSTWCCDVAWNLICRNIAVANPDFCWINLNLRPEILDYLAAVLETMDQNAASIPYSVIYSNDGEYFDRVTWAYQSAEVGLTCATFILAVLRGQQLELFSVSEWPSRPEDKQAIDGLIDRLEADGVEGSKIEYMRLNHNNVRFRPQEVCASVGQGIWPVSFPEANALGESLVTYLRSR